jgi:hypothetical protein
MPGSLLTLQRTAAQAMIMSASRALSGELAHNACQYRSTTCTHLADVTPCCAMATRSIEQAGPWLCCWRLSGLRGVLHAVVTPRGSIYSIAEVH